ncbi:MAG TPA: Holliday junction branch migration protein RuvA [Frankiaceae bacterium]
MIASLRGTVVALRGDRAVLDLGSAGGGVGITVWCTAATLATLRLGQTATLSTSLVVREDALTLYGFDDDDARDVFEIVQTASGVGPRLAQAMLAALRPDEVRAAVAAGDLTTLTRVPGIGQKGAARIALELKDKLGVLVGAVPLAPAASAEDELRSGLEALGYATREIDVAVDVVRQTAPAEALDAQLRVALRALRRG